MLHVLFKGCNCMNLYGQVRESFDDDDDDDDDGCKLIRVKII